MWASQQQAGVLAYFKKEPEAKYALWINETILNDVKSMFKRMDVNTSWCINFKELKTDVQRFIFGVMCNVYTVDVSQCVTNYTSTDAVFSLSYCITMGRGVIRIVNGFGRVVYCSGTEAQAWTVIQ